MNGASRNPFPGRTWLVGVVAVLLVGPALTVNPATASPDVKQILDAAPGLNGLCVFVGCDQDEAILALAERSGLLIHALDRRGDVVAALRKRVDAAGLWGSQIVVEECGLQRLPHADNTVDVLVVLPPPGGQSFDVPASEAMRVLRPGGVVLQCSAEAAGVRAVKRTIKPEPKGFDDWSHWEHGPDNNPVSTDQVIKAPYMTQWLGLPLYITMPSITTAAGGRMFIAMGHIAHHVREESWLNTLLARNGYNGTILWQRKLPDGYMAHRSAYVATDDVFYMIDADGEGCVMLDPETGREKGRIELPGHPGQWKWMAMQDGKLFVLLGPKKDPAETTLVRSQYGHWSWGELSSGYYQRRVPWGFGRTILAYDMAAKKVIWAHTEDSDVDSRAMVIGGGHVCFYAPDARLGRLYAETGELLWTNSNPQLRELIEQPGRGLGSTPGFKSTCYCLYTPEALFFEAQTRMNVVAVSHKDGKLLWHRKKTSNNPNMLYLDEQLYVGIGAKFSTLVLEPMTGKMIKDLHFAKRSCARLTATTDSLFCRGMPEGLTRYDRKTGKVSFNGAVRPACNDGVIGANGLLYMGPWACDCNLSLMGRLALCSAGSFKFDRKATEAECLVKGKGNISKVAPFEVTDGDWWTYRGNVARSSSSPADVPKRGKRLWRSDVEFDTPTAPTAAGGLVFVCDGDGKVAALDAATGKAKWTVLTAGPIMQAPTIWKGRVYVGSGDGCVYALEAATGRLLWRFRTGPTERRIMVYGRLCSTWPVNSGVLIKDGVAYAAAGIIDYDGTYVYALDAITGKIKWQNTTSGHLDASLRKGVSAQGILTVCGNELLMPGGNVVPLGIYRLSDGKYQGIGPGNGSPRSNRGEEIGIFNGHCRIVGGRLRYSARENVVNPGSFAAIAPEYDNFSMTLCMGKIPPAWDDERVVYVNGRKTTPTCCSADQLEKCLKGKNPKARPRVTWVGRTLNGRDTVSLALAKNAVLAVSQEPIQRQLRMQWRLTALKRSDGSKLWEHNLSGPALTGSLIVDRDGRAVVVLKDGRVECYGS
jgi:outer membrane protein assembly factor BamB